MKLSCCFAVTTYNFSDNKHVLLYYDLQQYAISAAKSNGKRWQYKWEKHIWDICYATHTLSRRLVKQLHVVLLQH